MEKKKTFFSTRFKCDVVVCGYLVWHRQCRAHGVHLFKVAKAARVTSAQPTTIMPYYAKTFPLAEPGAVPGDQDNTHANFFENRALLSDRYFPGKY
jgi:hypothetical protein